MVSRSPSFCTMVYWGIRKICPGTISTERTNTKIMFLNGKSILANAYAAIEQNSTCPTVVITVEMIVFIYTVAKGRAPKISV